MMAKSKSSNAWLQEHFDDEYVKKSQQDGYRSRAVYKLEEIQQKDKLIKPNMNIIDLGAAPGGWSQYAVKLVGKKGRVIASDILDIDPLPFVEFIKGDFTEQSVLDEILDVLKKDDTKNNKLDVVISDMAPNISGVESIDLPRSIYLCELALEMAREVLKPNGSLVVKLFQGQGSDEYLRDVRNSFRQVKIRKPKASRARSKEVYVVARNFHS
ncbi:MAG TPA: 23S rRNA (uridine(2552)-2'-O)-methyltransferase RlmE [Leucothrix mucor]|uniref:Ribosomal RNA large subunit methyltransferase E n=1 Tax=Leucothrix mucor TaxID=45248 RepID=A0A7V2T0W3_LEUMU|nr:23S rRNA (uridine(2552)-2'-O)-methyltransferase RlmE [Leucothrix mucor]